MYIKKTSKSPKFEIIGKWFKVPQAAHDCKKKESTYSAQCPEAAGFVEFFSAASPGGPIWDSRHVKCGLLGNSCAVITQGRSPRFFSH
jgi:hypothetical protein